MARNARARLSARDRLLAAADALFYEEGVNTVGIDRVIEQAGVAKASLYSAFGSKDELIRAYLAARLEARQARVAEALAGCETPRERLLAVYDVLGEIFAEPGYRGCALMNASAEARPGSAAEAVTQESRAWTRGLFRDLAHEAGAANPEHLAEQLVLLYDGATVGARMDRNAGAAAAARAVAASLIDAAIKS
jgi:AcrR family transcriptional regulator